MEEEWGTTEKTENFEGELRTALQAESGTLPSTEFVKVEKNLASLGFFTPSSKRLRNTQEKSFTITTITDGKRLELKGTIIPSAKYGLPITADQDKWIALCKILNDIMQKEGRVTNPISFTSADILRLLRKHRHSGKNYREVEEWLDVLFSTTIFSEGIVYLANEKRRVKDRFRVFERAVSFGKELPDGKVADKNYVWFSEWQLQNINSNHLLPIDLEAYRELKNHIAKALVPLLQVWLYATRKEGSFEKRYDELCQMLNIQQYRYFSLIMRMLAPSLDELAQFGYLADWKIERTSDGGNYKIVFYHGEKFYRDRRARLSRHSLAQEHHDPQLGDRKIAEPAQMRRQKPFQNQPRHKVADAINETFLAELTKRGVTEMHARRILADISPDQPVIAQLEWGDLQVQQSGGKILNPAGFYISLVSGNVTPPPSFETASQRKAREEADRQREEARQAQQELEVDYEWYRTQEINVYIAALDPSEVAAVVEAKRRENQQKYQTAWLIEESSQQEAKRELGKRAPLMTLEEFKARRENPPASFSEPTSEPLVSDTVEKASESKELPVENIGYEPGKTPPTDLVQESKDTVAEELPEPTSDPMANEAVIDLPTVPPDLWAFGGSDPVEPQRM
jgi:hypothetical protein